jgi:putative Ca2+/H+ antiporter (TMEM165/GDT1 family)
MLEEYFKALFFIFIAEMGDKTQILAMAFATKYNVKKVMLGIFLGSFANHGIAVALGSSISNLIPLNLMQFIAGCLFVFFGLWSLKIDDLEEENNNEKFGPILTIAIAFFIGELGDKTQLTAITLSSDSKIPIITLMGTVSGMVATGALGIVAGSKLGKKIPEFTIKIISSIVFLIFGISKIFSVIEKKYFTFFNISIILLIAITLYLIIFLKSYKKYKTNKLTAFKKFSEKLYQYYSKMKENIEYICLGKETCTKCKGSECIIGYTKLLIDNASSDNDIEIIENLEKFESSIQKSFDKEKLIESLIYTINFIENNKSENQTHSNRIRNILEKLLFGRVLLYVDMNNYLKELKSINPDIYSKISKHIKKQ